MPKKENIHHGTLLNSSFYFSIFFTTFCCKKSREIKLEYKKYVKQFNNILGSEFACLGKLLSKSRYWNASWWLKNTELQGYIQWGQKCVK